MNTLFLLAAHNTIVALVLALVVYRLTRVWRNPPVAHVLWLLVLIKLVAPPVVGVEWLPFGLPGPMHERDQVISDASRIDGQKAESQLRVDDRPPASTTEPASATAQATATAQPSGTSATEPDFSSSLRLFWNRARPVLIWFWLGGALVCAIVAATRIVRFERLLRDMLPASERLQRLAREIAGKLGVRRVPDVRYAECVDVPLLWCAGHRPTIVLPMRLLRQLDDQEAALILAHELAHLRRRDHWVRGIELVVSTVYWWNPLVGLIRRQIHQSEDLCCDAWVRWVFPDCTRRYAEVVLKTAESLSMSQVGARWLPASPFLRSLSLKARIEMILDSRFAPSVSRRSMFVIALVAFLLLPSFVQTRKTEVRADSNDKTAAAPNETAAAPAAKPDASTTSEFPYKVEFEQGATRFLDGDKITILEVRGTADTLTEGNIYCIKGTYTLASHDEAMLAAFTTARDAANGTGPYLKVQTATAKKGDSPFTLYLPMSCRGWPHVSFYPIDKGGSFGGNYFGTGDSVLKQWWGPKQIIDQTSSNAPAGSHAAESRRVVELKQVAISKAYWPDSKDAPEKVRGLRWSEQPGRFFVHFEWLENERDYLPYKQFVLAADQAFLLRAKNQPDVSCTILPNSITSRAENLCEFEVVIPKSEYSKMAQGVAYTLHPVNGKKGHEWQMAGEVTLTRGN